MKQGSTLFLKIVISLIGLAVAALGAFLLWTALGLDKAADFLPLLLVMYVAAIPFFYALYQAFKLLVYIDEAEAFSDLSTRALKNIKYSALVIAAVYLAGMPLIIQVAEMDDASGVTALGVVFIFASLVIATFAALLQRLLQDALEIKSENELTV